MGAAPRGRPGWPESAFCTASIASVRIVSTDSSSSVLTAVLNGASSFGQADRAASEAGIASYYARSALFDAPWGRKERRDSRERILGSHGLAERGRAPPGRARVDGIRALGRPAPPLSGMDRG